MIQKMKTKLVQAKDFVEAKVVLIGASMFSSMAAVSSYALKPGDSLSDSQTQNLISNIGGKVLFVFSCIGFILLIWGVGQLVLAFKNEDADSKSRAIMVIVCSVALMGLKGILSVVGIG